MSRKLYASMHNRLHEKNNNYNNDNGNNNNNYNNDNKIFENTLWLVFQGVKRLKGNQNKKNKIK